MTETIIDLPSVIARSDGADFLRELIQEACIHGVSTRAVSGARHAADGHLQEPGVTALRGD